MHIAPLARSVDLYDYILSISGLDHEDDNDELTNDEEDVDDGADEEDDFHHAQYGHSH